MIYKNYFIFRDFFYIVMYDKLDCVKNIFSVLIL